MWEGGEEWFLDVEAILNEYYYCVVRRDGGGDQGYQRGWDVGAVFGGADDVVEWFEGFFLDVWYGADNWFVCLQQIRLGKEPRGRLTLCRLPAVLLPVVT